MGEHFHSTQAEKCLHIGWSESNDAVFRCNHLVSISIQLK
jgi:hypothetical protein